MYMHTSEGFQLAKTYLHLPETC